jgi:predicted RNA-binding Zn-ribbon protein involved in translation (DUF1610 family)
MINRRRLKCVSCGTLITTRTGIGHSNIQKHKFACPNCGVEIGYILNLDQEAVTFEYREPTNAKWDDSEEEGEHVVLFYPELMIPRDLPYPMSPFVATCWNLKDIQEYQSIEASRRHFKDKLWPIVQRVYVHFENENWSLLSNEAAALSKGVPDAKNLEELGGWLMAMTRFFFDFFVIDPGLANQVHRRGAIATRFHETELRQLAADYIKSKRMAALWKEIKSVRRQFMVLYESMQPLLMVRRYWQGDKQDIGGYSLSVKNFEDLKGFYIDCVETAFRLLVIGLGIECILKSGRPVITTKTGDKSIWWFEQVANGIKETQLKHFPVFALMTPSLDVGLRNGVGHHSAHYDVKNDSIVYVKADEAALKEMQLSYTAFVDKVFQAYCAFELATVFFQWLFLAGGGKL